jgi:hypothetical protein
VTVRTTALQNRPEGLPAEELRLLTATFLPASAGGLHAFSGVLPNLPGHLGEVTLLTPETARINPARWIIAGTQAGTQGDYVVTNDAPVERAIGPRDATLTRLDRLVVSVRDTAYQPNEGEDAPDVRVIPGTPALTGAALPPVPPNALVLGYFTVPPGSGTVTFTPTIVPQQVPVGGVVPLRSNDARLNEAGSYDGQLRRHPTRGLQEWSATAAAWGAVPLWRARATSTEDLNATSTGHALQAGPDSGQNIGIGTREIAARNNGVYSDLLLYNPLSVTAQRLNNAALARLDYIDQGTRNTDWADIGPGNGFVPWGPGNRWRVHNGQFHMIIACARATAWTGGIALFTLDPPYKAFHDMPFTAFRNGVPWAELKITGTTGVITIMAAGAANDRFWGYLTWPLA